MTVVTGTSGTGSTNEFDSTVLQAITSGTLGSHSSTQFEFSNAYFILIGHGTGFGYSGGHPSGGTMTSLEFQLSTGISDWSGFSVSVATVWSDVSKGDVTGFSNLFFGGNDTFNMQMTNGEDVLAGGAGNDTFNYGYNVISASLDGGTGTDTLNIDGAFGNMSPFPVHLQISNIETINLTGGHSYDFAYSPSSAMTVNGSALLAGDSLTFDGSGANNGALTITGGAGNDTFVGGNGNETFNAGAGDDTFVSGAGNDVFNAGTGSNTVDYSHATSGVTVNLNLTTAQAVGGGLGSDTLTSVENIIASQYNDTLTGNAADNYFTLGNGAYNVNGGAGNDTASFAHATNDMTIDMRSGSGSDTFTSIETVIGSPQTDTFIPDNNNANSVFDAGGSNADRDIINYQYANGPLTITETGETPHYPDAYMSFTVTGGGQGTDTLTGFTTILGSNYDDTFYLLSGSHFPSIAAGGGFDTISFQYATAAVEFHLNYEGTNADGSNASIEQLIGSSFDDNLIGTTGNDIIYGGAGNDTIDGGVYGQTQDGNDIIHGGDGNDVISGNAGSDTIYGDAGNDTLSGGDYGLEFDGNDVIYGGTGNDTLYASASAGTNTGNCTLDGGPGDDQLWGGDGNDTALYSDATGGVTVSLAITTAQAVGGGLGTDTLHNIDNLTGSNFNDTLSGDSNNNILNGGNGTDTVSYADATDGVSVNLGNAGVQVVGGGQGSDTLISIENLIGSNFDDSLHGNSGNNVISGLAGNDTLDLTAGGNDTAQGGDGNDTFRFGAAFSALDKIDGGTGTDTVTFTGDYSAGVTFYAATMVNVETLLLSGGFDYKFTTADANVAAGATLTVNASALGAGNFLNFSGAAETDGRFSFIAGAGNDVLKGGAGNDSFTLTSGGNDNAQGGAGDDTFVFGASFTAADIVNGGAGNDTVKLEGDYSTPVIFGASTMLNVELINLVAGHSYNLTTNDTTVAAGQTLTINGTGLGAADVMTVNGSHEQDGIFVLHGGAGNDVLTGGYGNDTITGGLGNDTITGGRGADLITPGGGNDILVYTGAGQSTGAAYDTVSGFDFTGADKFDLPVTVSGISTALTHGALSTASFDTDLASALGSAQLASHHAMLFTPNSGTLMGQTFLVIDSNGVAGYQAGADYVIHLSGSVGLASLDATDFI